jgi:acyl carrier protein
MNFEELKEVIVDTLGCDEDKVTEDANLMEDLEADSLDIVELHMALEDKTGKKISDEELANLKTVKDVLECINKAA